MTFEQQALGMNLLLLRLLLALANNMLLALARYGDMFIVRCRGQCLAVYGEELQPDAQSKRPASAKRCVKERSASIGLAEKPSCASLNAMESLCEAAALLSTLHTCKDVANMANALREWMV